MLPIGKPSSTAPPYLAASVQLLFIISCLVVQQHKLGRRSAWRRPGLLSSRLLRLEMIQNLPDRHGIFYADNSPDRPLELLTDFKLDANCRDVGQGRHKERKLWIHASSTLPTLLPGMTCNPVLREAKPVIDVRPRQLRSLRSLLSLPAFLLPSPIATDVISTDAYCYVFQTRSSTAWRCF